MPPDLMTTMTKEQEQIEKLFTVPKDQFKVGDKVRIRAGEVLQRWTGGYRHSETHFTLVSKHGTNGPKGKAGDGGYTLWRTNNGDNISEQWLEYDDGTLYPEEPEYNQPLSNTWHGQINVVAVPVIKIHELPSKGRKFR